MVFRDQGWRRVGLGVGMVGLGIRGWRRVGLGVEMGRVRGGDGWV